MVMKNKLKTTLHPTTLAAQALGWEDLETGAVAPPIYLSTTYARNEDYTSRNGRTYQRDHGLTQRHAEELVCRLEEGEDAISFASGLAACTAPFHALDKGDHVAVSSVIYHGVLSWLELFAEQRGIEYSLFEAGNLDSLSSVIIDGQTRLVWLETPCNPTWGVTDIGAACEIAHNRGVLVAVDSTVATPVLSQPIKLGADFVCHSATKYLNGHSDVLGGMLVCADSNSDLWDRIRKHRLFAGPMMGSFEAYLLTRGMRTLFLRVRAQCENAMAIASYLHSHPAVERVHYPGLPTDPGYEIARKQMTGGFGGMVSILVPGGRDEAVAVVSRARVFKKATSLGGVESLIEHRKTSESDVTSTPENLIRLSIGIESVHDLIDDLDQMLGTG
jgi:cystathionine gamma-synthase